mmetsp:Transcript_46365/g.110407  ORF Transcript_46365/g.110407 Transcript_46365/m.110407 type:complete len:255 (+) Transcript_46365:110-874(+)
MEAFSDQSLGTVSLSSEPQRPVAAPVQHSFPTPAAGYMPPKTGNLSGGASPASSPPAFGSSGAAPSQGASMQDHMAQQIAGSLARSAADRALGMLRYGAGELRVFVEKNHYSVHVLSLLGGLFLAVLSLFRCIIVVNLFNGPLQYILNFYQLVFGTVICVIDGPGEKLPYVQSLVVRYAPFLQNNFGRCLFYTFIACLEGSQDFFICVLLGYYFAAIAIVHAALKVRSLATNPHPSEGSVDREEHLLSYTQAVP